jgi:putative acetyltransferase
MEIRPYLQKDHSRVLEIWEASVQATHHFLSQEDFQSIRDLVFRIDFSPFLLYIAWIGVEPCGFIGIESNKVAMLFIHPRYFRKGIGTSLMDFAFRKHQVLQVDVNEQNHGAVSFYQKLGFEIHSRSELDDQGKPYPILRLQMKVSSTKAAV